jgi:hypothetical protein
VRITAMVVGDVAATNGALWIRVCERCAWASEAPGLENQEGKKESRDRTRKFATMFPNVELTIMELHIIPPMFPVANRFLIAGYYSCENCPPTNPNAPQTLTVNVTKPKLP